MASFRLANIVLALAAFLAVGESGIIKKIGNLYNYCLNLLENIIFTIIVYLISVSRTDVIRYFSTISGSNIISGQHNREPNSDPTKWTRVARDITGLFPGLWGGDFLFLPDDVRYRQTMVDEAIRQWNAGSVVALTWHVCPPTVGETCNWDANGVLAQLNNDQWNSLVQNGGDLNTKWKQRLDTIVPYLQQLQDAGVVVIWRPIHEMNEGLDCFWFSMIYFQKVQVNQHTSMT